MKNKLWVVGVVVLILVLGWVGVVAAKRNSDKKQAEVEAQKQAMMAKDKMAEEGSMADQAKDKMGNGDEQKMMDKDSSMKEEGSEDKAAMMKESSSTYVDYSPEVLKQAEAAQKSGRKVVLFFHATWCPYCIAADKDFKSNIGTDKFPSNVTLIKTDYDTQTELKQKYGVTHQHTFVQIDSEGRQITKWVSGETTELKTNIK